MQSIIWNYCNDNNMNWNVIRINKKKKNPGDEYNDHEAIRIGYDLMKVERTTMIPISNQEPIGQHQTRNQHPIKNLGKLNYIWIQQKKQNWYIRIILTYR